jgi:hypothetical protein
VAANKAAFTAAWSGDSQVAKGVKLTNTSMNNEMQIKNRFMVVPF